MITTNQFLHEFHRGKNSSGKVLLGDGGREILLTASGALSAVKMPQNQTMIKTNYLSKMLMKMVIDSLTQAEILRKDQSRRV